MSWSDLPAELLTEIINQLEVADVVRFGAACVSWRSGICRDHYLNSNIPWMMMSSPDDDKVDFRYFYSLTENRIYTLRLPEIAGQHCVGSSQGFLFSVDDNAQLVSTNPLAGGAHLPLPPTSALPDIVFVVRDSKSGQIVDYMVMDNPPDFPDDPDLTGPRSVKHMHDYYYRKVILSPDLDTAVTIHGFGDWLAFLRIGGSSWTALNTPPTVREFDDMIFRRGLLHAVNFMGTLAVFDLDRPSTPRGLLKDKDGGVRRYLVESPDGDNLFLVLKECEYRNRISRTINFEVYVLEETTYTWKQIKTLGEISFFLGFNHSIALCTRGCNRIKKNCIYFMDDNKDGYIYRPELAEDMGVFSLGEASVECLYSDDKLDLLNWPPPIWFVPTLHHR